MIAYADLPHLNAILNGTSALLLFIGYYFIRKGEWQTHHRYMMGAAVTSGLFLVSYLTYHYHVGSVRFHRQGWLRPVYFSILISHTVLAATVLPMVVVTLRQALTGKFSKHRGIARWTLPIWVYVSITGVAVYLMLYHL